VGKWLGLLLVAVSLSCSDGGGDGENQGDKTIGEPCDDDTECSSDNCVAAGVCSEYCATHSDCGCDAGTSNENIANGGCGLACVEGLCTRPCESDLQCGGTTECQQLSPFSACQ
jgi:hypothetical protein